MPEPEELYHLSLMRLAELNPDQLAYLANLELIEDGEEEIACDDMEPKLTDEEWGFILEVTDG